MNTNDQQFLKAYNELVAAFFNFMNVVNPQNSSQSNLSYIASQLNQLLNFLKGESQGTVSSVLSESVPIINTDSKHVLASSPVEETVSDPINVKVPIQEYAPVSQSVDDSTLLNPVIKFCAYPELTNGLYKFKSSALKDYNSEDGGEESEEENHIYKLTIDEEAMRGFVEMADLSPDQINIISNNPTQYTPQGVCLGANNITPGKTTTITSKSKLHLIKVVRGWVIPEGEKFILDVK